MHKSFYRSVSQDRQDFYILYMNSRTWRLKRREVIIRDNNECQTCCSQQDLEVHHRHYDHFGNELLSDLILLCKDCHDAITSSIRFRRNVKRGVKLMQSVEQRDTEVIVKHKKEVTLNGLELKKSRSVVEIVKEVVRVTANRF